MKKLYTTFVAIIALVQFSFSQNSNPWPLSGNVGIGTTTPSKLLTLSTFGDDSSVSSLLRLEQYNAGSPVGGTGVGIDMAIGDNYNLPGVYGQIRTVRSNYTNSSMYFATALSNTLTDRMVIDPNGNIGIGTTTPDAKLAVKGTIHTQEVKVDMTGWSDYIFKKSYRLPSLMEVKTYIDQNHHLPDMPSEKDVKDNGLNLGEINKILTKKVEELTLYMIEKDSQLKAQETRLKKLEDQIRALTQSK